MARSLAATLLYEFFSCLATDFARLSDSLERLNGKKVTCMEEYVQLESLLFVIFPILSRLRVLLDDPRIRSL